ncbi:hypothetical protein QFC22_001733 [Naganishia vaughanmartiniae]|uniref:Uncharacterized protein n=1 Tax=Naganishia vaughanmartiniae TaxID=1424756 RepID=A0ACC2XHW4_9TREE|nr:hypothetical protein QFC22_001733 [Naganishia vaughanmartiniae]
MSIKAASLLSTRAPGPLQAFIDGYPYQRSSPNQNYNLEFYMGNRKCQPDNMTLDQMRRKLNSDMEECEYNHGWVQWLYPIRAQGVNPSAQPLQPHEINSLLDQAKIQDSLLDSYRIWLKFLGIRLVSPETGLLGRSPSGFEARTRNFRQNSHNLLRISRVMQWLSEFKMERHSESFLLFLLAERKAYGWTISSSGRTSAFADSVMRYYMWCYRDDDRRARVRSILERILEHDLSSSKDACWTVEEYQAHMNMPE